MAVENPKITIPGLVDVPDKPVRPYQRVGTAYMLTHPRSILAEPPGAGKKLTAIMSTLKSFETGRAQNALVVSLGTDVDQWDEEFDEFTEDAATQIYRGTPKERRWMLQDEGAQVRFCSYQTAAADLLQLLGSHDIWILDETSFIKNHETNAHECLRTALSPDRRDWERHFRRRWERDEKTKDRPFPGFSADPSLQPPKFVWGLTATPMETSPFDIWALYYALQGKYSIFGTNAGRFKKICVVNKYTVKGGSPKWKHRPKIRIEKVVGIQPEWKPWVREQMKEHHLRHPWATIAPYLPELNVPAPIWLEMGKRQRDRYKEISSGDVLADFAFRDTGEQKDVTQKQVEYALKQFYQMRCCDGLTSLPGQRHTDSVKLSKTIELLTGELGGEKVVTFSRYHQPLNDLQRKLDENGVEWSRIDGTRSEDENTEARKHFNDRNGSRVLLVTMKAQRALNLQAARYMICFNTLFNPKALDQLYGRLRRGKSGHVVTIIHLLCKATSEEAQWQLLRERESEFGDLFELESTIFDHLTPEEQADVVNYGLGSV